MVAKATRKITIIIEYVEPVDPKTVEQALDDSAFLDRLEIEAMKVNGYTPKMYFVPSYEEEDIRNDA